jgi:nitrite reductase/ring-hydroxylating ferredoxin subunit
MDDGRRICSLTEVPEDSTFLFTVREVDADENREAILVRLDGEVACWLNYCQHFTHITLDKGTGAEMRDGEIVCTNHGAYFESDTGLCTFGPCEGAVLTAVEITVTDGEVFLTDDDYEYGHVGPIERDADDLVSKSNYEF